MEALAKVNNFLWKQCEAATLPSEHPRFSYSWNGSIVQQILVGPITFALGSITGLLQTVLKTAIVIKKSIQNQLYPKAKQISTFQDVLRDSRIWDQLKDLSTTITNAPPGKEDPEFEYAIASCTYQDSGAINCPNSQWAEWETKCLPSHNRSGISANLFELYSIEPPQIIHRLQQLGITTYRTSIEWSQIEPAQGNFNYAALVVYKNFFTLCNENGIKIDLTLHHFSEPKWFHKMGSFAHKDGADIFANFTNYVIVNLVDNQGHSLINNFWTINEPAIEAFSRFIRGAFSPGNMCNFKKAANFLLGAFKAHNAAYAAIKLNFPQAKVGFTHQYLRFIPKNPLLFLVTKYLTALTNGVTLGVLEREVFELKIPFLCNISQRFKLNVDLMGVQVYTRPVIGLTGSVGLHNEPMTLMPFREDPAALYEAVKEVSKASQKPVKVTEFGISTHDETQYARFMTRALYAFKKAIDDGVDLKGITLWTFAHQLEWDMGMNPQRFGVYPLAPNGSLANTFRSGVQPFIDAALKHKQSFTALKATAG